MSKYDFDDIDFSNGMSDRVMEFRKYKSIEITFKTNKEYKQMKNKDIYEAVRVISNAIYKLEKDIDNLADARDILLSQLDSEAKEK